MATAAHLRILESDGPGTSSPEEAVPGLVVDDAFVHAHAAYVRRLVCRMGVPASDVDDAVQEVFLAALRRAGTFEAGRSPRAWLFGIARHCARKVYRGAREVSAGELPEPSVAPEQEAALERTRARSMVHQALGALPEAQRDVVILHKLEGWPMPNVAEAVGCSVATAQSRYRLGRVHIERIIRGRVVRARFATAVAMMVAVFGWNAPTAAAAAAAVALCLVGGGYLLARPTAVPHPPLHQAPTVTPSDAPARADGAVRAAGHEAVTGGAVVEAEPMRPTHTAHPQPIDARAARLPSEPATMEDVEPAAASAQTETAGDAVPTPVAAAAPVDATSPVPSLAPSTGTEAPQPSELEAWAEEGRLLRRARRLASSDPTAARAVLREYRQRFPSGRMAREAARLGETLGL